MKAIVKIGKDLGKKNKGKFSSHSSVYKENIAHFYMKAAKQIGLTEDFAQHLLEPEHSIETTHQICPKNPDGSKGKPVLFKGFRSIHKSYLKPSIGAFRMDQHFELEDYEAIAQFNSIRFAIGKIPMTGSGGGISLARKFRNNQDIVVSAIDTHVTELAMKNFLGPHIDVMMSDLNTGPFEMDQIARSYIQGVGNKAMTPLACVTGKSLDNSGIKLTANAKASGGLIVLERALNSKDYLKKFGISAGLKGKKVIFKGFGERNFKLANMLKKNGAIITGIYEQGHGIMSSNENGFNPNDVRSYFHETGRIQSFPQSIIDNEVFYQPCDILISSITGVENQFDEEKAKRLRCATFLEFSMGNLTPEADSMLNSMGVLVIPDVIALLGEPVASYIEYMVNTSMNIEYASLDKNVCSLIISVEDKICI